MRNTIILGGIAVAILVALGLRKNSGATLMEEKVQQLQDKFKSLDAA